jgi:predicted nucleic acid-binding protein
MTFADVPAGESLLPDANPLVYDFAPHPVFEAACHQLAQRITAGDVLAFTSTAALSEVAHRLMTIEATTRILLMASSQRVHWSYQQPVSTAADLKMIDAFGELIADLERHLTNDAGIDRGRAGWAVPIRRGERALREGSVTGGCWGRS